MQTVCFQAAASPADNPTVRSHIRPLIGTLSSRPGRTAIEIPIDHRGPRVRAPPTFRRLTASETLNDSGRAAFGLARYVEDYPWHDDQLLDLT